MITTLIKKLRQRAEVKRLSAAATPAAIQAAYSRRKKEIESLRQYDRGEKKIVAPDLRTLVRRV